MRILKITEEYRVENESEAKNVMDHFREEATEKGYSIGKMGYTHKTKKAKGEIVDEGELLQIVKIYDNFWE